MEREAYSRLTPMEIDAIWQRLFTGEAAKPAARALGLSTGLCAQGKMSSKVVERRISLDGGA